MASYGSAITQQSNKNKNGLKTKHEDKKKNHKFGSKANFQGAQYEFELDVDIRKTKQKAIFEGFGKLIYEVEWINRDSLPIVLLQIDGVKLKQEALFYVELSSHPHIVHTYGLVQSNPGSIMFVQERALQGNLSELLRENEFKPSERVLWKIFEQICDAMIFLADKKIIHGNLSCRNVLVFQMNPINPDKNLVKLTDFGLTIVSKLYSVIDNPALTTIPTRYAAPELLQNPKKFDYSQKSDVYSMGVLMWEACSYGELPYSNIDHNETIRQLKLKDERLSQPSLCSDHLWTIINKCWDRKSKKRPDFQSLKQSISNLQSKFTGKSESKIIPDAGSDPSIIPSQVKKGDNLRTAEKKNDDSEIFERCYKYAENVDSHETNKLQNGSISCPFCQEYFASSIDVHDHLVQCGSKTDQCPNCRLFIQRAVFAYHYENNCANINDTEISNELNNSPSHHFSRFSSENSKEKVQSRKANIDNSSEILQCKFCHNHCEQSDYEINKEYCLQNSANENKNRQQRSAQSRNDKCHSSNELVFIPCEYCQEQYSGEQLRLHEMSCLRNPNVRASSTRPSQERPSASRSVRSIASPKIDDDATSLLTNEASNFLGRDSKSPSVNEHTHQNLSERYCCCCS